MDDGDGATAAHTRLRRISHMAFRRCARAERRRDRTGAVAAQHMAGLSRTAPSRTRRSPSRYPRGSSILLSVALLVRASGLRSLSKSPTRTRSPSSFAATPPSVVPNHPWGDPRAARGRACPVRAKGSCSRPQLMRSTSPSRRARHRPGGTKGARRIYGCASAAGESAWASRRAGRVEAQASRSACLQAVATSLDVPYTRFRAVWSPPRTSHAVHANHPLAAWLRCESSSKRVGRGCSSDAAVIAMSSDVRTVYVPSCHVGRGAHCLPIPCDLQRAPGIVNVVEGERERWV
ncbi:hypothetical protein BJ912DRAFT_1013723 [Pholiota molesta]|nr:hypothetical protein BJ912DRAFT_1013723 [Pholiota molesta]